MAALPEDGSVVLIHKGIGIVRYVGAVHWDRTRTYLGIALCDPMGIHDGSYRGYRYFRCKDNHGVFVEPKEIKRSVTPEELLEKIVQLNHMLSENQKKIRSCESFIHELEEDNLKLKNEMREMTDMEGIPQMMPLPDLPRKSDVHITGVPPLGEAITAEQLMGSDVGTITRHLGNIKRPMAHTARVMPSGKGSKGSTGDFYEEMGQDIGSPLPDGPIEDEEKTHFRGGTAPVIMNGMNPPVVAHDRLPHSVGMPNGRNGSALAGRVDVGVRIPNSRIVIDDDLRSLPTTLPDLPDTPVRGPRNSGLGDYKIEGPVFSDEDPTPNDQRRSYADQWNELGLPEKRFQEGTESPRRHLERFRKESQTSLPSQTHHRKTSGLAVRQMFEENARVQDMYTTTLNGTHARHGSHGVFGGVGVNTQPQSDSIHETESRQSESAVSSDGGRPLPEDAMEEIVEPDRPAAGAAYGHRLVVVRDIDGETVSSYRSYNSGSQSARKARPHIEHFGIGEPTMRPNLSNQSSMNSRPVNRRGGISTGHHEMYSAKQIVENLERENPRRSQLYGNNNASSRDAYEIEEPSMNTSDELSSSISREDLYKMRHASTQEERALLFQSAIKKLQEEDRSGKSRKLNRFSDGIRTGQSRSAFGYDEADRMRDGIYRDGLNDIDEHPDEDAAKSEDILSDDAYYEQVRRQQQTYRRSKRGRRSISEPVSPRVVERAKYMIPKLQKIPSTEALVVNEYETRDRNVWERDGRDWLAQMDRKLEDAMRRFDEAREATLASMSNSIHARMRRKKRLSISAPGSPRNGHGSQHANLRAFPHLAALSINNSVSSGSNGEKRPAPQNPHGSALERHMRTAFAGNRANPMSLVSDGDDIDLLEDADSRFER